MNNYVAYLLPLIATFIFAVPYLNTDTNEDFVIDLKPVYKKLTSEKVETEQNTRREILKRACKVVGDLNQFSKNGTS